MASPHTSAERTMRAHECVVRTTCVVFSPFGRESCGVRNARFEIRGGEMAQNIRDVMTSNPSTVDAEKSVAYAAKMMREEDVGLAPIVEGDKLIGMLTDRDIATRVAAQGRNPDQVKVRDVASKQLGTIDPRQDLDGALRMRAVLNAVPTPGRGAAGRSGSRAARGAARGRSRLEGAGGLESRTPSQACHDGTEDDGAQAHDRGAEEARNDRAKEEDHDRAQAFCGDTRPYHGAQALDHRSQAEDHRSQEDDRRTQAEDDRPEEDNDGAQALNRHAEAHHGPQDRSPAEDSPHEPQVIAASRTRERPRLAGPFSLGRDLRGARA